VGGNLVRKERRNNMDEDFDKILQLVSKVDLINCVNFMKFNKWKQTDGSLEGLEEILKEQEEIC
jgi:hypothetical protein